MFLIYSIQLAVISVLIIDEFGFNFLQYFIQRI